MKHCKILILLLTALCFNLKAEEIVKLKYGKVTVEELQMVKYDQDTSAEAVVLYQYAEFNPQLFSFHQHYRIKILKKTGMEMASMVFSGKLKSSIKGVTYNYENGAIIKSKLTSESIFEERVVGNIFRTRIAMPNVKVGSVFEVSIQMEGLPDSYEIQRTIPILYGGIYIPKHPNIDFRIKEIGYLGYSYKGDDKWIIKDLPSFKMEPYITSDNDYRLRMEFEITSYNFTDSNFAALGSLASTWNDVTNNFIKNPYFGGILDNYNFHLNAIADSLKLQTKNEEELARHALQIIKKIKWNGQIECFASQELKKTYQQKQGNSADINFNLIQLLKKLGLKSYPVIFSTRDHGKLSSVQPTLNKFNYVIAAVELPSGKYYLDATDEYIPFGLPSEHILGCFGYAIDKDRKDCSVNIEPTKKQKKTSYSQLMVDSSGNISGHISIKRFDYNSIDFKNLLKSKPDHDTYIQELESENSGWNISKYSFSDLNDLNKEFVENYDINFSSSIGNNDLIIVNPFILIKSKRNPFQKDKRYLPISFPQQTEYMTITIINIPKNYQIAEIPKGGEFTNSDKTIRFTYQIQSNESTITISTKFLISKLYFEAFEYHGIRGVFETMLAKQNESIVLKKI